MDFVTLLQILDSTVRLTTPLLFACLAGLFSERAGVFDIGLEGKMLAAAFMSAAVAALVMASPVWSVGPVDLSWLRGLLPAVGWGLLAGIGAALVLSVIHGLASITFRGNQLISGVALNFLVAGMTVLIAQAWFRQNGRTPTLRGEGRFEGITLPFALGPEDAKAADRPLSELIREASVPQQVYSELISGHAILVYVAFLAVPLTWWILFRTRFGLRLRAVGENPAAVDTAGVSVAWLRFAAVLICGVLCGIAGAYLATALQAGFTKDMTAGRGFIALAALIFAKWRPGAALAACLLFGLLGAISIRFQSAELGTLLEIFAVIGGLVAGLMLLVTLVLFALRRVARAALRAPAIWATATGGIYGALALDAYGFGLAGVLATLGLPWLLDLEIPVEFMQALPYILTVVILAGFVGKAIPPRAGGEAYVKER